MSLKKRFQTKIAIGPEWGSDRALLTRVSVEHLRSFALLIRELSHDHQPRHSQHNAVAAPSQFDLGDYLLNSMIPVMDPDSKGNVSLSISDKTTWPDVFGNPDRGAHPENWGNWETCALYIVTKFDTEGKHRSDTHQMGYRLAKLIRHFRDRYHNVPTGCDIKIPAATVRIPDMTLYQRQFRMIETSKCPLSEKAFRYAALQISQEIDRDIINKLSATTN